MVSPPMTPGGAPRVNAVTFAEPDFDNQDHAGKDTEGAHEPPARSDDDTLAAASDAERKDSKDKSPSFRERITSAPQAAKKKIRLKERRIRRTKSTHEPDRCQDKHSTG